VSYRIVVRGFCQSQLVHYNHFIETIFLKLFCGLYDIFFLLVDVGH
jgi:hypothetical protein